MAELNQALHLIIDEWMDELIGVPDEYSMSGADELERIGQEIVLVAKQMNKRIEEEENEVN